MFDSGVGGLTVLRALQSKAPSNHYLYLGDTARLPYGTKSRQTVIRYALQASKLLLDRDIDVLVVACNTASAFALPQLKKIAGDRHVFGVIQPGATAALEITKRRNIAVIATDSTIRSCAYENALLKLDPRVTVSSRATPLLVALAEEGWTNNDVTRQTLLKYLGDWLTECGADVILLGCTHFYALRGCVEEVCGQHVQVVDSAGPTADRVVAICGSGHGKGSRHFLATDDPHRFARVGRLFLGEEISVDEVELVDL